MTTIKDIAELANVSIATVSHVINKTRFVSQETTNRVLEVMDILDYQPNFIAKSLKTNKSNIVACVIPDITNPFFAEVCRGFQDIAAKNDYVVVVFNTDRELLRERKIMEIIQQYRINGLVINPAEITIDDLADISKNGVKVVLLGNQIETDQYDIVLVDNIKASFDATSYLISLGHERIALINGSLSSSSGSQRSQGFINAMQQNGLEVQEQWVSHGDFSFSSGYQQAIQLLSLEERPTAIFATNDILALGVLSAANDKGIHVPEELSIIGFDNISETERTRPRITTIDQSKYETGRKAGELIFAALASGKKASCGERIILQHTLIVRESTQPPA